MCGGGNTVNREGPGSPRPTERVFGGSALFVQRASHFPLVLAQTKEFPGLDFLKGGRFPQFRFIQNPSLTQLLAGIRAQTGIKVLLDIQSLFSRLHHD